MFISKIIFQNVDFNAAETYRTRMLSDEELLEQLPALQQLLYRLTGCKVKLYTSILKIYIFVFSWNYFLMCFQFAA